MATIDSLPPDQRAVLQLVLQRGRSYDQIASMLSIDRAAVRHRALDALEALAPVGDEPAPAEQSLIIDYLLGQLPERVAGQIRALLASSQADRAWALAVADQLRSLPGAVLPEIPPHPAAATSPSVPAPPAAGNATFAEALNAAAQSPDAADSPAATEPLPSRPRRAGSRRGGLVLLGGLAAIVVAVVVIVLTGNGSSNNASKSPTPAARSSKSSTKSTQSKSSEHYLAQINLTSPTGDTKAKGIVQVVEVDNVKGIVVVAQGIPANTNHNAYAVWLSKTAGGSKRLGSVRKKVGSGGEFQAEAELPADATTYSKFLITIEDQRNPKTPGTVVLSGAFHE